MSTREKSLVVKSNALVNAMLDLTLQGNRFLAFAISLIDRTQVVEGKPVELDIPVLEFAETFQIAPNYAYGEIEALADQFQRKIITLQPHETLDGSRVKVGLVSKQKYLDSEGRVLLRFDEDLVPHLLGLQGEYTKYRIQDVYQFSRASSWRVYELLRQFKEIGKREIELEDLRWKLGLADKYERPIDLKKWIIEPAIEEINTTSDLLVQYEQKKRGRRITALIFHIRDNPNTKTPQEKVRAVAEKLNTGADNDPDFSRLLREEYRVSPRQARELCKLATMHDAVERLTRLLPKIKSRYEKIPRESRKTSLGGYIFRSLHSELMPKLPLGPDA
jgi:plasmid replication initiation protein